MPGLKRKNSKTEIDTASAPLSMEQMEEKVQESLTSVGNELSRMEEEKEKRVTDSKNWAERIQRVDNLISLNPEKDEALEALKILKSQAENFYQDIVGTINVDDDHMASLREQKTQLTETIKTIERMKKKEALNGHLSKVSASLGNASQEMRRTDSIEIEETSREVSRVIHNANALIELRSDKTDTI